MTAMEDANLFIFRRILCLCFNDEIHHSKLFAFSDTGLSPSQI